MNTRQLQISQPQDPDQFCIEDQLYSLQQKFKQQEEINTNLQIQNDMLEQYCRTIECQVIEKYQESSIMETEVDLIHELNLITEAYDILKKKFDDLDTQYMKKVMEIDELKKSMDILKQGNISVLQGNSQVLQVNTSQNLCVSRIQKNFQQKIFDNVTKSNYMNLYQQIKGDLPLQGSYVDQGDKPNFLNKIMIHTFLDGHNFETVQQEDIIVQDIQTQEYIQQMIFPFKSTIDYYLNNQKEYKGQLVARNTNSFKNLENMSRKNQYLLIKSCCEGKNQLYDNSSIVVFQQSQQILYQNKPFLSITLLMRNIEINPIQIQLKLKQPMIVNYQIWIQPDMKQETLRSQQTLQYEFLIKTLGDNIPEVELDIQINYRQYFMYLPCTLIRMLQFKDLDCDQFRSEWKDSSRMILKSNTCKIRSRQIFKKFLVGAALLNPQKSIDVQLKLCDQKYGLSFRYVDGLVQYTFNIKINLRPTSEFVVQACSKQVDINNPDYCPVVKLMKQIIQQLCLIYGE